MAEAAAAVADPAKPAEPVAPVVPAEPAKPVVPAEPAKPVEAAKPAEPVKPAEPAKPAEPPAPKAPDKYSLKVPADKAVFFDDVDLKAIEAMARTHNLSNEQAQTLLEQQASTIAAQSAAMRAVTEADPIYGGDNLIATQRYATAALDKLRPAGTPHGDAFRRTLVKTGYGNNLEVVSFLADLGKMMAEDTPLAFGGGSDRPAPRDPASVLYDGNAAKK